MPVELRGSNTKQGAQKTSSAAHGKNGIPEVFC